jgi:hypothetical protein
MSSRIAPTSNRPSMIGWLCEVFGFVRQAVYEVGLAVSRTRN